MNEYDIMFASFLDDPFLLVSSRHKHEMKYECIDLTFTFVPVV